MYTRVPRTNCNTAGSSRWATVCRPAFPPVPSGLAAEKPDGRQITAALARKTASVVCIHTGYPSYFPSLTEALIKKQPEFINFCIFYLQLCPQSVILDVVLKNQRCRYRISVVHQLPKLGGWVRLPLPALFMKLVYQSRSTGIIRSAGLYIVRTFFPFSIIKLYYKIRT